MSGLFKMKYEKSAFPFKSPAKVSDEAVVAAQKELDETELDFREPGWAQVARGIHEGATSVLSSVGGGDEPENGDAVSDDEVSSVNEIVKKRKLSHSSKKRKLRSKNIIHQDYLKQYIKLMEPLLTQPQVK